MKVSIGGREQIASTSLLVPSTDDAWIEFQADEWSVRIKIIFADDKESQTSEFKLEGQDDHAVLTIKNWNSSLPAGITEPFLLGETKGRKLSFLLTGYAIGSLKKIDMSFFWEKGDGK